MGSGEYKVMVQVKIFVVDVFLQIYFEFFYFFSFDGVKMFFGSFWYNNFEFEEGVIMWQFMVEKVLCVVVGLMGLFSKVFSDGGDSVKGDDNWMFKVLIEFGLCLCMWKVFCYMFCLFRV